MVDLADLRHLAGVGRIRRLGGGGCRRDVRSVGWPALAELLQGILLLLRELRLRVLLLLLLLLLMLMLLLLLLGILLLLLDILLCL